MYHQSLLPPLFAQALLTFIVMFWMYHRRVAEFKAKRIHPERASTRSSTRELLTDSAAASDNFQNLFEMPVLFFAAMLLAINYLLNDPVLVSLAWLYVILRVVHSLIHMTYNRVIHRFYVFALSAVVLLGIWVRLASIIFLP